MVKVIYYSLALLLLLKQTRPSFLSPALLSPTPNTAEQLTFTLSLTLIFFSTDDEHQQQPPFPCISLPPSNQEARNNSSIPFPLSPQVSKQAVPFLCFPHAHTAQTRASIFRNDDHRCKLGFDNDAANHGLAHYRDEETTTPSLSRCREQRRRRRPQA